MAFTTLIMQLEQCQMVVCKFIAAVQYNNIMHVLRQLHQGFCTIVLHFVQLCGARKSVLGLLDRKRMRDRSSLHEVLKTVRRSSASCP